MAYASFPARVNTAQPSSSGSGRPVYESSTLMSTPFSAPPNPSHAYLRSSVSALRVHTLSASQSSGALHPAYGLGPCFDTTNNYNAYIISIIINIYYNCNNNR